MNIHNYTSSDLDACRSLWVEMVHRHRDIYNDQSIGGENPGLEFDSHLETVGADRIWLAEIDSEIVGLVSLIFSGQEAEIEPVVVADKHRGEGIGEELIKHVIGTAKKLEVLCLYVKPVARNKEAIAFFCKCGFNKIGHVQLFTWLGEEDDNMWKDGLDFLGMTFKY